MSLHVRIAQTHEKAAKLKPILLKHKYTLCPSSTTTAFETFREKSQLFRQAFLDILRE